MAFNLGTAAGRIIIDGSGAKSGFGIAEAAANAFYDAINAKLDSIERMGDKLTKVGITGSAGLGVAVKAAATFEKGLSAVRAVSGATSSEMDSLRDAALRIGKATSFSATEAASAMEELAKAGVSTKDILSGAADATVALAAAGEIELPRAAEIAASAMNNFSLSGKELPRIADLIAGAANASAIDVGDFGFSLSQAGATAKLSGLSFDDLAVAIAEMGQAGIKGSDAGTSIKTFLTNLIPTTNAQKSLFEELGLSVVNVGGDFSQLAEKGIKPASKSFKDVSVALEEYVAKTGGAKVGTKENAKAAQTLGSEMGLLRNSFFDAKGDVEDFATIQENLKKAMSGLTKEQQLSTLNTLFGSDALRASAVFSGQGAEGFNKMAAAMGKITAAEVAATRLDNLNGSVEQLKGSFETMLIIIGDVFLPFVRKVVDGANALIGVFLGLPEPMQKFIAVMIGVGSAMSLFLGIAIKLAFILGPMLARFLGFMVLRQVFSIFTVGFSALRAGTGIMAALSVMAARAGVVFGRLASVGRFLFGILARFPALLGILRTAVTLAFGPWGLALAAVVTAAVLAYKHFKPFRDLVDNTASIIKGAFTEGLNFARTVIDEFTAAFERGNVTTGGFMGKIQALGVIVKWIWGLLQDLGRAFMENVVPALREAGGQILDSLKSAWRDLAATFKEQILPALSQLKVAFMEMLPTLQDLWSKIEPVAKILGIVAAVIVGVLIVSIYAFIKAVLEYLLPGLIKLITFGIQALINIIQFLIEVFTVVLGTVIKFATGIVSAVGPAIDAVIGFVRGFVTILQGIFNIIAGLFTGDWRRMWDGAKQVVSGVVTAMKSLIVGFKNVALELIKGFVNGVINFFKGLYNTLVGNSIVPDLVKAIITWIGSLPGKAASALAGLANAVIGRIRSAMNGMLDGIKDGIQDALALMRSIPGRLVNALGNLGGILRNAGQWIVQGLIDGIASWVPNLKGYLQNITQWIQSWKGPMDVDKKLLTKNGTAIMQSLLNAFEEHVPLIKTFLGGLTQLIADGVETPVVAGSFGAIARDAFASKMSESNVSKQTNSNALAGAIQNKSRESALASSGAVTHSTVNNTNYIVNNPVAEKTSITVVREATRRAMLGAIA